MRQYPHDPQKIRVSGDRGLRCRLWQAWGGGWVGEEALAISLYCALVSQDDFARGVLSAVNHSGDSDSTGSITGNLLGLTLGVDAIPEKWLAELELRAEIEAVAGDLLKRSEDTDAWRRRYPAA